MRVCANLPLPGRDLRPDLFRGLANLAIFLDHIPHEPTSFASQNTSYVSRHEGGRGKPNAR
jgi:OpgC protein